MKAVRIMGQTIALSCSLMLALAAKAQTIPLGHSMATPDAGRDPACVSLNRKILDENKWISAVNVYNAACCYALEGRNGEALALLRRAVNAPDFRVSTLAVDPDLASLHNLPEWPRLVRLGEEKAKQRPPLGASVDLAYMRRHPPVRPRDIHLSRKTMVSLVIGISADDHPDYFIIERSSGDPALDQVAAVAASKWKYRAAVADGVKFPASIRIPIIFEP